MYINRTPIGNAGNKRFTFSDEAFLKFDELLVNIEKNRKRCEEILGQESRDKKWLNRYFKAHEVYEKLVQSLIELLAPKILRMPSGDNKRNWQRRLNRIRKAKVIFSNEIISVS